MARTAQIAQVGKRTIELSNLSKVLYPDDHIVKAELVQYYLTIAPTILAHIKGRPLSLVRFPDGIMGEKFFQKNRPAWAPEWLEYVTLGEGNETKDYVIATEPASLVWLANLACIELHQMHARAPKFDIPDYVVFDLDPPETYTFRQVAELALELKEHIERFGYHPFVKTTGRKGVHILVPVEPKYTFDEAYAAAEAIAKPFVAARERTTTLHLKKEYRKDRVFVDIFRNRKHQTIVAPYSVRGLPGAPVSTPLSWEELTTLQDISELNISTALERVNATGDPWEAFAAYAEPLHTHRQSLTKKMLPPSTKHKTPKTLEAYKQKRSFDRTPEPLPTVALGDGNAFVVHRHHASRLHYDLRLEQDGVLKSWAVPRGMPPRPGVMRLAVATEDHPLEYLNFEGTIPKGEYGGGEMWIYARGKYTVTKEKKNGFYFRLQSKELNAEYRMHTMKDKEWLLERVDTPQLDYLRDAIDPMLAAGAEKPPSSADYLFEVKWDGIRALIALDDGQLTIRTRNNMDITQRFPELLIPEEAFRASTAVFDAEIVCLDRSGTPVFKHVIHRLQQTTERAIERARAQYPTVCYVFDCLYLDGRPIINEPLLRRRLWMADAIKRGTPYRVSETVDDGQALFDAAKEIGLEGIMAKAKLSLYQPGKRSPHWLKIKTRQTMDCVIIGYTRGKGNRASGFGALHLAVNENGTLRYVGKVGTGFDATTMKQILTELTSLKHIKRPVNEKPPDDASSTYVEPKLVCEVEYASWTKDNMLREPVFVRLRPDV